MLREIAPAKGKITSEVAAFNSNMGIKVRQSAKDWVLKKYGVSTNLTTGRQMGVIQKKRSSDLLFGENLWHLMIKRELAMRESARGFTSYASRFGSFAELEASANSWYGNQRYTISRYGKAIGAAGLKLSGTRLEFDWGKTATNQIARTAAKSLSQSRPTAMISKSLRATSSDMRIYIQRKLAELAEKSNMSN
jgi:hypothetical protein